MSDSEGSVPPTTPFAQPAPGEQPGGQPGPGWWMASDGRWYPPTTSPGYTPSPGYTAPGYGNQPGYAPAVWVDPNAKSRVVAGILQLCLGGLGIGRFYLGYTNIGIAQLLVTLFTCGLGAIWTMIDGIMILTGSITVDGYGRPLKD